MEDTDWAGEELARDVSDDTPPSDIETRFQDLENHSLTSQTLDTPQTPQTPEARTPGSTSPLGPPNHSPVLPIPHSPNGGHQVQKGGLDDEGLLSGVCPICLQPVDGEAYLDPCFHRFCFSCILQWSEMGVRRGAPPLCPVCKGPFFTIIHDFRGTQFKKYDVLGGTSSVRFQLSGKHVLRRAVYEKGGEASEGENPFRGKAFAGVKGYRGGTSERWLRCWVRRELQALLEEEDVEMVALHIVGSVELLAEQRRQRQKFGKNARPLLAGDSDSEGGDEGLVRQVRRPPPRKEKKLVFGKTSLVLSKAGLARRKARKGINGSVRAAPLPEKKRTKRGGGTSESGRSGPREKGPASEEKKGKEKQELAAEKVLRWLENGQAPSGEGLGQDHERGLLADLWQGTAEQPPGTSGDSVQGVLEAGNTNRKEARKVAFKESAGKRTDEPLEGVATTSGEGQGDEIEGRAGQETGPDRGVGKARDDEGLGEDANGMVDETSHMTGVEEIAAGRGTEHSAGGGGSEMEASKGTPGGVMEGFTPAEENTPAGGVNEEGPHPEPVSAEDEEWLRVVAAAARPFIFENADRFAAELLTFLSSGLDIASYDAATLPAPPVASPVAAETGLELRQGADERGAFAQRGGPGEKPLEDIASLKRAIDEENEGDYYVEGGLRAERQRKKKKRVEYGSLWTAAKEDLDALPRAGEGGVLGAELPPQKKEKRRRKRREEEGEEEGRPKKQRHGDKAEEDSDFERRQHRKRRRRRDRHRRHRAERSDSVDKSDSSLEKAVHAYRKKLRQRKKDGRRMSDGLPLSSTDDEAEGWADWRRRMKKLYRFCKTEVEESEESDGGDRGGVKSPGIVGERGFVEGQKRGEESGSGRGERGGAEREGWERREQETGARRGEHGSRSVDKEWFGEMRREGRRGKRTERTLDEMYEARGEQMGVPNDRRRWSDDDGRRRVDDVAAAEGPTRGTSLSELPGTRKDHHWRGRFGDVSGRDDDVSRTGPSRAATASGLPRRGGLKRSWGEQDEGREGAQDGFNKKQARVRWEDEESPEGARTEDVSKKVSSGDAAAQGLGVQESERWNGGEENGGYRERFEEGEEERGAERSSVEQRGSVGVAGVRRVVQSLSDLTRRRKGGAQAGEEGSRHEGLAGQGASQRDAATPPERDLCIEELQAELQEVELRKRALASLSHFLKAKTKVGAAPNSPAKGSKTLGPCQRGGTEPGARQGGSAGVGGQPGGVGRGRANAAGGAKVVGLERGGAPAGVLKSGVQLGGGKVGRARLAAGLKVGVTRKVTALGAVGESVAPKKLGPGAVAKGALTRKVVRIGMVQRPVLTAALAATGGTPSGPRLAAPQIAQQLLSKGDGSPARRTGPGVKKALVGGDIQRQEDGSLRRVVEASQAVVIAANRRGGLQPLVQKKVVVASPKGVSKSAAAAKTSGSVPEKGPLVQREPSVGGLQTVPPGGQQKLPRGRPQQPPGAPAVGQGSQGTSIRKKSTAPGSQGVQVTISGKVGNAGSKEQKAPSEAGKQQPGQLGRPEPGPPAQKVAPVGTRLTVPTTPSTSVTPNGKLAPGRMLKEPAPPPARLNPPGTKSGPNAVTKGSLQAAQLPGGPEKAAKLVAPGVNSRPKVSPPTLVRPRVVQAPKTSPTTRSPPGVTGKLQWVRPQPTPVPGSKSTDVLKRPIIAPAANAQKRTVTIASAATALKVPSFPLGAPSMSAKPGDSANPPLRGPLKAPPNSARNPVAAPPRGLAPRAPTGYPGQSYGLSRPGSNKWQRSPGTAQPIRPPVTVPQRKNLQWVRKEAQPATAVATKPGFVSNAGTSPKPSPTNKVPRATAAGVGKPGDSAGVAKVGRSIGKGEAGWKPKEKVVQGSVSPAANCVDKKIILVESKKGETAKVSLAGAELKD